MIYPDVTLMQKSHGKGSTCCGNSDSTSRSIISSSDVEIFVHINHILAKLCRRKLEVPVITRERV